jgi:hypothetical protein
MAYGDEDVAVQISRRGLRTPRLGATSPEGGDHCD